MGSRGYRGSSKRGLGYRPGPLFSGSMRVGLGGEIYDLALECAQGRCPLKRESVAWRVGAWDTLTTQGLSRLWCFNIVVTVAPLKLPRVPPCPTSQVYK